VCDECGAAGPETLESEDPRELAKQEGWSYDNKRGDLCHTCLLIGKNLWYSLIHFAAAEGYEASLNKITRFMEVIDEISEISSDGQRQSLQAIRIQLEHASKDIIEGDLTFIAQNTLL